MTNKKSLTQKYLINGPNNAVRLTNGDKVIYIFSDFHYDLNQQTECPLTKDYESIDIDKLLFKFFKKELDKGSDTKYDMFIETEGNAKFVKSYSGLNTEKYLGKIRKLFNINNYVNDKNQVIKTDTMPNVRFHYFDFRFETTYLECNYFIFSESSYSLYFPYSYNTLLYIEDKTIEYRNKLSDSLAYLNIHTNDKSNKDKSKHIHKILNKYSNPKIKTQINKIYDILIIKLIKDNIQLCNNILDYITKNKDKLYSKYLTLEEKIILQKPLLSNIELLSYNLTKPYAILTDLYLIRRILDKKYTKNNIIYAGAYHFADIITLLVKYFDFEITNIFHNELDTPGKLTQIHKFIKNIDINDTLNYNPLFKYITNGNDGSEWQCIDMFDFPNNFT
jgi:hypothetical protein